MSAPSAPSAPSAKSATKKLRTKGPQPNRVQSTVYDAVASRLNYEGFIKPSFLNEFKETRVRSGISRPADEVLARRRRAPDDVAPFTATAAKGGSEGLPDNDLLLAVHQYASDFYCANGMGPINTRSLDETALIAIGLLLEETMAQALGESGHLALVDKRGLELKDRGGLVRDEHDEYYDEAEPGDPTDEDEDEDEEGSTDDDRNESESNDDS